MKPRSIIIKILAIALTFALLLLCIFTVLTLSEFKSVQLEGGTQLSLAAVTKGGTNKYIPGGVLQRLINRFAPANGIHIGTFNFQPLPPIDNTWRYEDGKVAWPNQAVIWLRHLGPANASPLPVPEEQWFSDVRAAISDETGEEWEARPGFGRFHSISSTNLDGISSWNFSTFPRRGKQLKFKLYGRNKSSQWDSLAEFKIANPARGHYPKWQPMTLPASQTNGDLEVSLIELVSGTKAGKYLQNDRRPFTLATFKVIQNGQPTEAWLPDSMKAIDATGNEGNFQIVNYGATNGLVFYDAQTSSLSPSEVWRLGMRFCKEKSSELFWASPNLPVRAGILEPANITTNFQTGTISLVCSANSLRLNLKPMPQDSKLRLQAIVDDRGTNLDTSTGMYSDHGFDLQLRIPVEAHNLKVTIFLQETRQIDFVAQPAWQKK